MIIDTHLHTKYSRDCLSEPKKVLSQAKAIGLDGIVITDHDNVSGYRSLSKKDIADSQIQVICGEEITTDKGEIIALFLNDAIAGRTPLPEVLDQIKEQDAFCFIPHPFDRLRKHLDPTTLDKTTLAKINGIEIYNSRITYWREDTQKALYFAKNNPRLIQTGGSDSHFLSELGKSYIKLDSADGCSMDEEEIRHAFFKGNLSAFGKPNSILYHVGTKMVKFLKKNSIIPSSSGKL
ncbi:MAG: PHP domain-containing protein [Candidatus Bilamarchaeum sp.]|jgi:predicted metal-dependent phosphoesterase TrpH